MVKTRKQREKEEKPDRTLYGDEGDWVRTHHGLHRRSPPQQEMHVSKRTNRKKRSLPNSLRASVGSREVLSTKVLLLTLILMWMIEVIT